MSKDVKELLKEATKDLLTPESLTAIEEAVNAKASALADEKVKLQVEAALVAQDDKHAEMLKSLMEKMDTDYTAKLQKLIVKLDESYGAKLLTVKDHYEAKIAQVNEQLEVKAKETIDALSGKIDTFLESRFNEVLPVEKVNEACENTKAAYILNQIRELVGIDESVVSDQIKSAMIDGKKQIDESKAELEKLIAENAQLKAQYEKTQVDLLLEQKTAKLPAKKREHVKRTLSGKDVKFINENIEYVCEMFDREVSIESEKAKKETATVAKTVDTPVVVTESAKGPQIDPQMQGYLANLK